MTDEPLPAQPAQAGEPAEAEQAADPISPALPQGQPSSGGSLDALLEAWPQVVQGVAANPANRPLILACRPVEVRDNTVVLGFPESQAFLRDIAERKRAVLEEALGRVLGRAIAVQCVVTNIEIAPPVAVAAGPDELVAHARQIFADDLADVPDVE